MRPAPAGGAGNEGENEQRQCCGDPALAQAMAAEVDERKPEQQNERRSAGDHRRAGARESEETGDFARAIAPPRGAVRRPCDDDAAKQQRADQVQEVRHLSHRLRARSLAVRSRPIKVRTNGGEVESA